MINWYKKSCRFRKAKPAFKTNERNNSQSRILDLPLAEHNLIRDLDHCKVTCLITSMGAVFIGSTKTHCVQRSRLCEPRNNCVTFVPLTVLIDDCRRLMLIRPSGTCRSQNALQSSIVLDNTDSINTALGGIRLGNTSFTNECKQN